MKTIIRVLALIVLCTVFASASHAQTPQELWSQADKAWDEKSYARALELYRQIEKAGNARDNDEVKYRIAVSLGETGKWDEAIAAGEKLLEETTWKARVLYWMGRLYTKVPHNGWKLGDKIYRGDDYPKTDEAEKPQQVYLGQEDQKKTLEYFERAKIAAPQEREFAMRARFSSPTHLLSSEEEIDLNFDLAAFIPNVEYSVFIEQLEKAFKEKRKLDENVDLTQPYNPQWNMPTKVLYLYNQIPRLDESKNKHDSALSLLAKGMFVQSYRQRMAGWANWYDPELKKQIVREYPFDHLEAISYWREAVEKFPRNDIAPQTQILVAQTLQQQGDSVKALAEYQRVLQLFPQSKWTADARAQIQQITKREVNFDTMATQPPGEAAKITVNTRNVKTVEFTAYRVELEKVLTQEKNLQSYDTQFTEFGDNFGSIDDARQYFGTQAAKWTFNAQDKGDYKHVNETITTPLKERGAYVIVAQADGVQRAEVLVISDLAILKKTDRDGAFAYVADAKTGKPVPGAQVVLKEHYHDGNTNQNKVSLARGQSSGSGFFDKKLVRERNLYSQRVEAFAYIGDRYAMTGAQYYGYGGRYGDNRDEMKVYSYTDRPVYRPAQKVYFRQILTQRIGGGDQQPVKGAKVRVRVHNPKGETIHEATLTSSEFGTINGEFDLPEETPLGEYSVQASVVQTTQNIAASGSNRFRVEEYKRPEFEITVDAPAQAVRPGETVAAKINAKYYFGSPVPNAKVKYTVRRSVWWANYKFPRRFDWLFAYWGAGDYATGRRNIGGEGSGEIVKEGETVTDAEGNAEVTFVTKANDPTPQDSWYRYYANPLYTIEAEVTDASRRTIEGQGQVKVADQQYFAFLDAKRGYYLSGDRVQIEVRTQDANDKVNSASGKMVVYRQLEGDKEEKVFEEDIKTDAEGRFFWEWVADEAGRFRIAYEATDDWGKKVEASTVLWVGGAGLNTTQFRLQGVTIVMQNRYYEEGQTAKALLIADQPDTTILWTHESGGEILHRELIHIPEKNREVLIPIKKEHVPNFAVAAALVKNYEVFQAQQEIFVPPVRQLVNIEVKGDKEQYKPGEVGTFQITAKDWQGKPARAEVSLAMVDASLFYIQKDYAPDIRLFYYGQRRAVSIHLDSHRSGNPQGHYEDQNNYTDYERHQWVLPDEMGQLNLQPGGFGYYGGFGRFRRNSGFALPGGLEQLMAVDAENGLFVSNAPMRSMSGAMPMAAPMEANGSLAADMDFRQQFAAKSERRDGTAQLADAEVRSNFAETAFWSPAVVTNGGSAAVEVKFPDSLTQWQATARGLTPSAQVGAAETQAVTKKDLLVRLQAPRFFVERDQVVLSANVHNYLKTDKRVKVTLQMDGARETATPLALAADATQTATTGANLSTLSGLVDVKAGEEARVNWIVDVVKDGEAEIQMTAQSDEEADAVKMTFPVLVHGIQRFTAQNGVLRDGQNSATVNINLPQERKFGQTALNVQLNPSLAATMLDALPYLADYPYGCVEQTMSRFLPSVVTAKVLTDSGVNLSTLRTRAQAYEKEAKAQPIGERVKNSGYTYPNGMPNSRDLTEMASRLWHHGRSSNPIYDKAVLDKMVNDGLARLYAMQRDDGGWGWWHGSGFSDEYMSAYVVYGLATARAADVAVRNEVLDRGYSYLEKQMADEDNIHLLTWMGFALSQRGNVSAASKQVLSGRLYEQRDRLTAYSKSLLALALSNIGEQEKARVLVRNIENTAVIDEANGTARWKMQNDWWRWWNNDVETNAWALRAFLQVDPDNKLAPMAMKWLTQQARSNHWRSTKETAMAVYALADYVRVNKELEVDYTLTVDLNGKMRRTYRVTSENALYFDNRFITGDLMLETGDNKLTITKTGKGNLYYTAAAEYFSLEEPIKAAGNEIAVKRRYFKLTRSTAEKSPPAETAAKSVGISMPRPIPVQPAEPEYSRAEIRDSDTLQSGDLIEVELTIDSANDYEYLVFEDMKAAGLEPVEIRSGASWGDGLSSNVELRDEKVALFVDRLPQGTKVLRYRMRAEIPGRFHALPTNGYAMYAPEVRAISDEMRMGVRD